MNSVWLICLPTPDFYGENLEIFCTWLLALSCLFQMSFFLESCIFGLFRTSMLLFLANCFTGKYGKHGPLKLFLSIVFSWYEEIRNNLLTKVSFKLANWSDQYSSLRAITVVWFTIQQIWNCSPTIVWLFAAQIHHLTADCACVAHFT